VTHDHADIGGCLRTSPHRFNNLKDIPSGLEEEGEPAADFHNFSKLRDNCHPVALQLRESFHDIVNSKRRRGEYPLR
jgi:hypothetical protein